jgi:protease-4
VGYVPPPPPPPPRNPLLGCAFAFSLLFNVLAVLLVVLGCMGVAFQGLSTDISHTPLTEHLHSGSSSGKDKVAIISLDGVIAEGLLGFVHRQIDQAAKDKSVKAVVLRINSPGGSITASDDLHRRLTELRDGNKAKQTTGRPLVVSMASLAASGGYYVAMPAQVLVAERTTLTGSIGVYASFPNVTGLEEKIGVSMEIIKQGNIKDAGSPFKPMKDEERAVWQNMVNHAYRQFVSVVEEGRPDLKGKMLERFNVDPEVVPGEKALPVQERYRADGGIFTADKAKELKLIDQIGYLDDAVQAARNLAQLGDTVKVIQYEKPRTVSEALFGTRAPGTAPSALSAAGLARGLTPRLWYLAPGADLAGIVAASSGE